MYKIREARIKDFTVVAMIHDDPINSYLSNELEILDQSFFERIVESETAKIYLVEKSGEIVGFILFYVNMETSTILLKRFSIREEDQKKGIDEHLYHKVKKLAEQQEIKQMMAEITTTNPIVLTFFIEKNWQPVGTDNWYVQSL